LANFNEIWRDDASGPSGPCQPTNVRIFAIQDGGGRHLEKSRNRNISETDWPILMKFGKMMHLWLRILSANKM